jgi:hypothetical protein
MDKKSFSVSTEIWAGSGLTAIGLLAFMTGHHDLLSQGLAPFGIGLILFDLLTRFGKATRESVRVMIRRDEE